jgi:molybdenum cofactor cytidylyltransferase
MNARCGCILLAAGSSARLGYPKQLLRADSETLLHRTARLACEAGLDPICVVLGSRSDELRSELQQLPVHIVANRDWQTGMSSSLRVGLQHLTVSQPDIDHVLVLVCDQVGLTPAQLQALLAASKANPKNIIASFYQGRAGVPAIFPAVHFGELLRIDGDRGARELLVRHAGQVMALPFPEGELDIDAPEDVARAGLQRNG